MNAANPPVVTRAACRYCGLDIENLAKDGRPDRWRHDLPPDYPEYALACDPAPPADVEQALPRENVTVRLDVTELVTHRLQLVLPVPTGVGPASIRDYLRENPDLWMDHLGTEGSYLNATDQDVVEGGALLLHSDTLTYLAAVAKAIEETPDKIRRWLTDFCPQCDRQVTPDDPSHVFCARYLAVGCEGYRLINPAALGLDPGQWDDWTSRLGPW
ncbi:hypothetical protein ACWEN6_13925 [Sphaerisporangium sp. NPDC004334]